MNEASKKPYSSLGQHLRYLREQQAESLADVSGAVEIDETLLEQIELGFARPDEEILMLLISHFDMQDQEAVQLWELAGYAADGETRRQEELMQDMLQAGKPVVFLVGQDSRVLYTDSVVAEASQSGVTLQFGQINSKKQSQPIARLGMSAQQAREVIKQIERALLEAEHGGGPKRLGPPQN